MTANTLSEIRPADASAPPQAPARLHRITGRARMCGPAAMSAVTGLATHDCAALLRAVTGRTQIHGVRERDLVAAMALAGWVCERTAHPGSGRPTLARWLREHDTRANPLVLVVRNHYIAVADGQVADSGWLFSRRPQPLATAPHRRVQVRETIVCRRPPDVR